MKLSRYIAKLEIRNFQTHEDTVLELHPGVNILTGQNRSGKSAVLRAIRLLAYNQPRDISGWIRHGKSLLYVRATMDDGSWVSREKGVDINRYVVFDPKLSGDPIVMDSVGYGVPPEVSHVLGIAPVKLAKTDGVELNLARQFDQAFMLSESDPDIARWLNSLTGLDDIRAAIDSLATDVRTEGTKHTAHAKRVEELNAELAGYDGLDDVSADLDELAADVAKIEALQDEVRRLQSLSAEMASLREQALPLMDEIDLLGELTALMSDEEVEGLRDSLREVEELEGLAAGMAVVEAELAAGSEINQKVLMLSKMDFETLREEIEAAQELVALADQMVETAAEGETLRAGVLASEGDLRAIEETIARVWDELFGSGEDGRHCPYCGGEVGEDMLDHLLGEAEGG